MSALRLVEAASPLAGVLVNQSPELRIQDVLAAAGRLWLRGQVTGLVLSSGQGNDAPRWWRRRHKNASPPIPTVHVQTRVGGQLLEGDTPLQPDGRFEATFTTDLPPARRGWRVARNQITCAGRSAEACALLLAPPTNAAGAVVVVFPWQMTLAANGPQQLERSDTAARLTPTLRKLQERLHALYYVACVPASDDRQAEWALAISALGWPSGQVILVPRERERTEALLLHTLDRLRWLFAGTLPLMVVNQEPAAIDLLDDASAPQPDRADIRRIVHPHDNPWALVESPPAQAVLGNGHIRPTRSGLVTRYPLVFCHGMLGYSLMRMQLPEDLNCFSPLAKFLGERGFKVLFPQVMPAGGVAERAAELRDQIRAWTNEPVNIIAHSMGGLDARYLISRLGMADQVRSLTMVGTPNRGTYMADWFQANFRKRVPVLLAMEALGVNVNGFRDCRPAACVAFNAATPDMPGVRYFSYVGDVTPPRITPVLRRAWNLLRVAEGPNDGMVSVASARWGEVLGTVHADHYAQTPDGVLVRPGEDFDSLGFYTRLVEDLARRGF